MHIIEGKGIHGEPTSKELIDLASGLANPDEYTEESLVRGYETDVAGFSVLDTENMYAITLTHMRNKAVGRFRTSWLGRKLLSERLVPQANLRLNNLEEPELSVEMQIYPQHINVLEGELGTKRTFRSPTGRDTATINNVLSNLKDTQFGE
jgi:hypothetical protein